MITKEQPKGKSDALTPIEKAIKTNQDLITKITGVDHIESVESVEEKKSTKQQEKKYKSFMKVASIIAIIVIAAFWATCVYVPNFYEAVANIISNFDPLAIFKGGRAIEPTNFVNFLN
jgi:quinol-cytochrome oxidoreductase complex cytochrome b subunit